jgi:glycine cleavage system H lipoate-binding protein
MLAAFIILAIFILTMSLGILLILGVTQDFDARQQPQTGEAVAWPAEQSLPLWAFDGITVPRGVFVDPGHTWVAVEPSGWVRVGADDFAQKVIGHIDKIELPEAGQEMHRGDRLFAIRQDGRTAVFTAPVDGVVQSVNEGLRRHPYGVKAVPYQHGWICTMRPTHLAEDLKSLPIAEDAVAWLKDEAQRFQQIIAARPVGHAALGHVLQDGGQFIDGVLESTDNKTWDLFTREFLRRPVAEKQSAEKAQMNEPVS